MTTSWIVSRAASPLRWAPALLGRAVAGRVDRLAARIASERRLRANMAEIRTLNDRDLADVGLTRASLVSHSRAIDQHESIIDRGTESSN